MSRTFLKALAGAACFCAMAAAQPADPAATARKALDLLIAGKYQEMEQMFTPALKDSMQKGGGLPKLGAQVQSWGAAEVGAPSVRPAGTTSIVTMPVKFATQNIIVMMGVTKDGQLSQFFMRPGEVAWQRPAYSKADSFHERDVTVGEDPYKLPGTLTLPNGNGPFPAVVLVHGTGPNDRDETVGAVKVFKDLAEGLASRGIAVLRYEKRTKLFMSRMAGQPYTVDDETVDDALSAIEVLRGQAEINGQRVYVLGHSLGGYMAARIAEQDGKVAGVIIMAANARPLEDIIVEQAEAVLGQPAPNETPQAAGERVKELANIKSAAARVKKLEPADEDQPNVLAFPVAYWVDLKGYDPVGTVKKLGIPVLVLYGERDFQVSAKDFAVWKNGVAGQKGAVAKSYPSLNHLFVAGEGKSTEAEYRKPGHVAPEVIDEIAKFIGQ